MSQPLVSVCLITFNQRAFVEQAVRSALAQQVDFGFEIVIGDDASTDGTTAVLQGLAEQHPGAIRLLTSDRRLGLVANFERTYRACQGTYVALIEGDDYWIDPHKLLEQARALEGHPECAMCGHAARVDYEIETSQSQREFGAVFPPAPLNAVEDGAIFCRRYPVMTATLMFRNGVVRALPAWAAEHDLYEWPLEMLLGVAGGLVYLDRVMSVYRIHGGNALAGKPIARQYPRTISMLMSAARHFGGDRAADLEELIGNTLHRWQLNLRMRPTLERDAILADVLPTLPEPARERLRAASSRDAGLGPAAGEHAKAIASILSYELMWRPERRTSSEHWHGHIPFAAYLVRALRPDSYVELGVWQGDSYCAVCQAVADEGLPTRCFGVDTWQGDIHTTQYDVQSVFEPLREHHDRRYGAFSMLVVSDFDHALPIFADGYIDLLHIDGTHTYEAVKHDFEGWLPKMSRRGVILFHDIDVRRDDFGVWRLWEELKEVFPHFEFRHSHGLGVLYVGNRPPHPELRALFTADASETGAIQRHFEELGNRVRRNAGPPALTAQAKEAHNAAADWLRAQPATREDLREAVRLIAFYLPQFYPTPENDAWWGRGFTEWTNVVQARPKFEGHAQPSLPADLGFYDLRVAETREQQARLAREHGIHGFCYYHYWTGGRRLLDRPFDEVLDAGKPDFPFCLLWANHDWVRNWDASSGEMLIKQEYSESDDLDHIRWLARAFRDPRYIRVGGRPLFIVYVAKDLPDARRTTDVWRSEARRLGIGELYLLKTEAHGDTAPPEANGFDGVIEFPPHMLAGQPIHSSDPAFVLNYVYDYAQAARTALERPAPAHKRLRTAFPSWDNSARKKISGAVVFHQSSPELYARWLRSLAEAAARGPEDERLVFVNAWNEWAEGAYLEPDQRLGSAKLRATLAAMSGADLAQLDGTRGATLRDRVALLGGAEDQIALADKTLQSALDFMSVQMSALHQHVSQTQTVYDTLHAAQQDRDAAREALRQLDQDWNDKIRHIAILQAELADMTGQRDRGIEQLRVYETQIAGLAGQRDAAEVEARARADAERAATEAAAASLEALRAAVGRLAADVADGNARIEQLEHELATAATHAEGLDEQLGIALAQSHEAAARVDALALRLGDRDEFVRALKMQLVAQSIDAAQQSAELRSRMLRQHEALETIKQSNFMRLARRYWELQMKLGRKSLANIPAFAAQLGDEELRALLQAPKPADLATEPAVQPRPAPLELTHAQREAFDALIAKLDLRDTDAGDVLAACAARLSSVQRVNLLLLLDFMTHRGALARERSGRVIDPMTLPPGPSQSRRGRLLFVTGEFPNPMHGGGGRFADFISDLRADHDIDLFTWYVPSQDAAMLKRVAPWCDRIDTLLPAEMESRDIGRLERLAADRVADVVHYAWPRALSYFRRALGRRHVFTYVESVSLRLRIDLDLRPALSDAWIETFGKLLDALRVEVVDASPMDARIVVTASDGQFLARFDPGASFFVVPTPVHFSSFELADVDPNPRAVTFVGNYRHYPNEDAMRWFFAGVFDRIASEMPDTKCYVVGADPSDDLRALNDNRRVFVTGTVDDVRPFIQGASFCIAPLISGAGIRGKVNQYAALRRTCVATSIAARDLPYEDGREIIVADAPDAFAERVIALLKDPARARAMGQSAYLTARRHYDLGTAVEGLRRLHWHLTGGSSAR